MKLLRIVFAILIVLLVGYVFYETKNPWTLLALLFLVVAIDYSPRLADITFFCPRCKCEFEMKERGKK